MGVMVSSDLAKNQALLDDLEQLVQRQHHLVQVAFEGQTEGRKQKPQAKPKRHDLNNVPRGCQIQMWKQDPSVKEVGVRTVTLPHEVREGPSDDLIEVILDNNDGKTADDKVDPANFPIKPDAHGNMLLDVANDTYRFDLVQVYAVVRMVLDMFIRDLRIEWRWNWDLMKKPGEPRTPIKICAHAGNRPNACYLRSKKMLKFCYFFDPNGAEVVTCRSLDVVAHETGHAVLDSLKPELYDIHTGQQGALHEAFGDLTAIFLILSQLDLCEEVVSKSKSDLRKARWLSAIGEQFGQAMAMPVGGTDGLDAEEVEAIGMRDANNTLKGSQIVGDDGHTMSELFLGYVYDILVSLFELERDPQMMSDAETLLRVARLLRRLVLLALFNTGPTPDFVDISKAMEAGVDVICEEDPLDIAEYKQIVSNLRETRELGLAGKPRTKVSASSEF